MKKEVIEKISEAAKKYTESHIPNPTRGDYLLVENAALIGAAVILRELSDDLAKEKEKEQEELLCNCGAPVEGKTTELGTLCDNCNNYLRFTN